MSKAERYFRRKAAALYLSETYTTISEQMLAKYACIGGGPVFSKFGTRTVLYAQSDLDQWAQGRLGPRARNATEAKAALAA